MYRTELHQWSRLMNELQARDWSLLTYPSFCVTISGVVTIYSFSASTLYDFSPFYQ
jgi:hypothetical protein